MRLCLQKLLNFLLGLGVGWRGLVGWRSSGRSLCCLVLGCCESSLVGLAWVEVGDLAERLLEAVGLGDEVVFLDEELVDLLHQFAIVLKQSSLVLGWLLGLLMEMVVMVLHLVLLMFHLFVLQSFLELLHLFLLFLSIVVSGSLEVPVLMHLLPGMHSCISGLEGVRPGSLSDVLGHHRDITVRFGHLGWHIPRWLEVLLDRGASLLLEVARVWHHGWSWASVEVGLRVPCIDS